jgi:hypothetical protein
VHLVISGEGNSDIGRLTYINNENIFDPAPMYYLIDKIIEEKYRYSHYQCGQENITFIPKSELVDFCKQMKSFSGKKKNKETALYFKNAQGLSKIAKEISKEIEDSDIKVILFRDLDGTNTTSSDDYNNKIKSMEDAFKIENINGVAMIPKPKSEAWLICALKENKYQDCDKLEDRSGNDGSPNNLKDELDLILKNIDKSYYDINDMIQNNEIDINEIDMPSFIYFKNKLEELL